MGFDQVLHLRYRLYLPALIGQQTLTVYDALRSCIWRQDTYGPEDLVERVQRGYLSAQVAQRNLSLMTGVARQRVNLHLKRLERMGWVSSTGGQQFGGPKLYELGVKRPQNGVWAEALYGDSVMVTWYEAAEGVSQARWGCHYRRLSPENQMAVAAEVLAKGGVTVRKQGGVIKLAPNGAVPPRRKKGGVTPVRHVHDQPAVVVPFQGGVTAAQGGVTAESTLAGVPPNGDLLGFGKTWLPDAMAFAFAPEAEGGVTLGEGGVTADATGVTEAPKVEADDACKSLIFRGVDSACLEGGGVTVDDTGCHDGGQVTPRETSEKARNFEDLESKSKTHIHNLHRMVSPTGKASCTTYKILSPYGETPVQAFASEPFAASPSNSLRSFADEPAPLPIRSLPGLLEARDESCAALSPPIRTPKPPVAPAPLSPGAVHSVENYEGESPDSSVTHPESMSEVSPVRSRVAPETVGPEPTPAPSPENATTANVGAPAGVSGGLADLASVVEAAKAKSRAAMEAKLAKQRAKDAKKANLTSDASYRQQKSAAMRVEEVWREEMGKAFPDIPQIAWFKRERGKVLARKEGKLVADLIDGYGGDETIVTGIIRSFVQRWDVFGPMFTKTLDGVPTLGLLYACHASVLAESRKLAAKPVPVTPRSPVSPVDAYETWMREHGGDVFARPPADLEAAYLAAKAKLRKGKP
jgi:hypothetical protein